MSVIEVCILGVKRSRSEKGRIEEVLLIHVRFSNQHQELHTVKVRRRRKKGPFRLMAPMKKKKTRVENRIKGIVFM